MDSKIKLKWGLLEIEMESSESFIKNELVNLIKNIRNELKEEVQTTLPGNLPPILNKSQNKIQNIVAKNPPDSGADLAWAACFCLTSIKKDFSRDEILTTMKEATGYYKKNYSNNLTKIINSLLKDGLNMHSDDVYTLLPEKYVELGKKFGQK